MTAVMRYITCFYIVSLSTLTLIQTIRIALTRCENRCCIRSWFYFLQSDVITQNDSVLSLTSTVTSLKLMLIRLGVIKHCQHYYYASSCIKTALLKVYECEGMYR